MNVKDKFECCNDDIMEGSCKFVPGRVSVIMPCYNGEKFIADAIDSVLEQTYADIELIVVDDGSTDQSVGIIKSYGSKISSVFNERSGACIARNCGLRMASGEFIQFLDADDILYPEGIKVRVDAMGEETDIVFGQYCRINSEGDVLQIMAHKKIGVWSKKEALTELLENRGNIITINPLHRRRHILEVGGFNSTLLRMQDFDLHLRLMLSGARCTAISAVIGGVREHRAPSRITNEVLVKNPGALMDAVLVLHAEIKKADMILPDEYIREKLSLILRTVVISCGVRSLALGLKYLHAAEQLFPEGKKKGSFFRFFIKAAYFKTRVILGKIKQFLSQRNQYA